VGKLRSRINRSVDSILKFKTLQVRDYHLLYESDSLVVTELVNMDFENFTYSENKITFTVKEKDRNSLLIRELGFECVKKND
jgi:hypothetical protein